MLAWAAVVWPSSISHLVGTCPCAMKTRLSGSPTTGRSTTSVSCDANCKLGDIILRPRPIRKLSSVRRHHVDHVHLVQAKLVAFHGPGREERRDADGKHDDREGDPGEFEPT